MFRQTIFTICALAAFSAFAQDSATAGYRQTLHKSRFGGVDAPEFKEKGWLFGRPSKDTPEEQFKHAATLETNGHLRAATRANNAIVAEWGASEQAKKAQLKVAELYAKRGYALNAFKEYQYFIEMYSVADDADFKIAIARQYAVANAELARMDRGIFSSSNPEDVADMFGKIISNAPDWDKAHECQFKRGAAREYDKDWLGAATAFEALASRYPASDLKTDALYRAAFARVKLSDKYPRDERLLKNAIHALRDAYAADKTRDDAAEAVKKHDRLKAVLSKMNFEKAEFYDKIRKKPEAAVIAYRAFAKEYDGSPEAEKALKRIAELEKSAENLAAKTGGK